MADPICSKRRVPESSLVVRLDTGQRHTPAMKRRDELLMEIKSLKASKPDGWKRTARKLLNELALLDDPYAIHEDHGTEQRGRHIHRTDGCPIYEQMGDNSFP